MITTRLHDNFDLRVTLAPPREPSWQDWPMQGVQRYMLDRVGGEVARATRVNGFANPTESGDAKKAGMVFAASEPGQGRAQPGEANP